MDAGDSTSFVIIQWMERLLSHLLDIRNTLSFIVQADENRCDSPIDGLTGHSFFFARLRLRIGNRQRLHLLSAGGNKHARQRRGEHDYDDTERGGSRGAHRHGITKFLRIEILYPRTISDTFRKKGKKKAGKLSLSGVQRIFILRDETLYTAYTLVFVSFWTFRIFTCAKDYWWNYWWNEQMFEKFYHRATFWLITVQ